MNLKLFFEDLRLYRDFVGTPIPKVGVHFGVCGLILSLSLIFGSVNVTPGLHFWPTPFHALALVASR